MIKRVLSRVFILCGSALIATILLGSPASAGAVSPRPLRAETTFTLTPTRTVAPTRTPTSTRTPAPTRTPTNTRTPTPTRTPTRTRTPTQTLIPTLSVMPGFAVGDSVMLGAARELQRVLPGLTVDAKVSRHVSATLEIVRQRRQAGQLGEYVIVHIGNNGYVKAAQFDELMQLLVDVPHVVIFNLKEPRRWESANNQIISDTVRAYPNAVLVDWRSVGLDHPEYFAPDGIHIGTAGARIYTRLIIDQLRSFLARSQASPPKN